MPSLLEIQRAFAGALRHPADGEAPGWQVYRGNVYGNRAKALAGAYPVVRKIVGEAFFEAMAWRYAREHSSASGDLKEYGEELPRFLAEFEPTQDLPYLPDVARMEWLAHRAYFAPDRVGLEKKSLGTIRPEHYSSLRLPLAPGCALLESPWPLGRLWAIHQDDYEGEFEIDLAAGPDRILVHRPRWRAQVLSLAPGDFAFLAAASRGETLGAALEAAVSAEWLFDASRALARWIDARVVDALV